MMGRRAAEVYEPILQQLAGELATVKRQVGGVQNTVVFDARVKMYDDLAHTSRTGMQSIIRRSLRSGWIRSIPFRISHDVRSSTLPTTAIRLGRLSISSTVS